MKKLETHLDDINELSGESAGFGWLSQIVIGVRIVVIIYKQCKSKPSTTQTLGTCIFKLFFLIMGGCHGRDCMVVQLTTTKKSTIVVQFTTTCPISAYHHYRCEFQSCSMRGVLDTTLSDKVCQWLTAGQWFSPGTPVSSTNKTHITI